MLKILRGQGKVPDGLRLDGLPSGGRRGLNRLHQGLYLDLFQYLQRHQLGGHARGFGNAHHDVRNLRLAEATVCDVNRVIRDRQKRGGERSRGIGFGAPGHRAGVLVNDPHIRVGNYGASLIEHGAGDGAGCAALSESLTKQGNRENYKPQRAAKKLGHTLLPHSGFMVNLPVEYQGQRTTTSPSSARAHRLQCAAALNT